MSTSSWTYHPYELAFTGLSGSGKTTLVTRLIAHLAERRRVAYLKHAHHLVDSDRPGKDTHRATESGACAVAALSPGRTIWSSTAVTDPLVVKVALSNADFLFCEGFRTSARRRVVVLDERPPHSEDRAAMSRGEILAFAGVGHRPPEELIGPAWFDRDDVAELGSHIEERMVSRARAVPLYGLVLAGGESRRMGRDKATIPHGEVTQAEHAYRLLDEHCDQTYLSCRRGQWDGEPAAVALGSLPAIFDKFSGVGPISGILSAVLEHPGAAWWVLPCDMPDLSPEMLGRLLAARDPFKTATAFRAAHDDRPEPLCTIYEPKARTRLLTLDRGMLRAPRRSLSYADVKLVEPGDAETEAALEGVNTPRPS